MIKENIFNMIKRKISLILFILITVFAFLFSVNYSSANMFDNGSNIIVETYPKAIGPNEEFELKISSGSFDIDRSKTKIFIDGKKVAEGYSLRSIKTKTKDNGKELFVRIESQTDTGLTYVTERVIFPADVDLTYESIDAFRPPFYKGGAEVLNDSRVKIVAFPEFYEKGGKKIATSDLIYHWKVGYNADLANSGYGKNYYYLNRITAGPIKTYVTVMIETKDGAIQVEKRIKITPKRSKVYFYLQDAVNDFKLINPITSSSVETERDNIYVRTVPYFMNEIGSSEISNSWFINGVEQKEKEGTDIVSINNNGEKGRLLKVKFQKIITNRKRPLQSANDSVLVNFEKVQRRIYNLREQNKSKYSDPIGNFFR